MLDRGYVAVLLIVLSALTFALIAGHGPWAGEEVVAVTRDHGLNSGDIPILAFWLVGVLCCLGLWRRR